MIDEIDDGQEIVNEFLKMAMSIVRPTAQDIVFVACKHLRDEYRKRLELEKTIEQLIKERQCP